MAQSKSVMFHGEVRKSGKLLWIKPDEQAQADLGRDEFYTDKVDRVLVGAGAQEGDTVLVFADIRGGKIYIKGASVEGGETPVTLPEATKALETDLTNEEPTKSEVEQTSVMEYKSPFEFDADTAFPVPAKDSSFAIPEEVAEMLEGLVRLAGTGERVNVRITGPQGTGKTTLGKQIAARLGWHFAKIDCGTIREASEWLGSKELRNDNGVTVTDAEPSDFVCAITTPNTVLLLDELNRTREHNAIYGLLDEHGYVLSGLHKQRIDRAPNVLVLATMNLEDTNVGVFEVDSALLDRFPYELRLELLPEPVLAKVIAIHAGCTEEAAERLAKLAHSLEVLVGSSLTHGTGHRSLIAAATLIRVGVPWAAACSSTVASMFTSTGGAETERMVVTNQILMMEV